MEIRQLKYFVSVAETSSFSEASRRCFLSQSAISQQIRALEDELGTTLFLRNPHKVTMTESGEELLPLARQALKSFETCREHINNLHGMLCGQLNIGMSSFIEPYIRQAAIMMLKQYPNVRLNLMYLTTPELNRLLQNHELDVAFSINKANIDEGIESTPAMTFHLRAVMRSTHPLASLEKVKFEDLLNFSIVMPEIGSRVIKSVRRYLDVDIERLKTRVVVNDPNAALNLLHDTNFITFLPARYADNRPMIVAKEIEGLEMPLQSYAHWMQDICQKRSAEAFLKIIKEYSVPYCQSMGL
ncbi:MAG: LysR family transcriptional regulator [Prevotellaceae bacterium]|nr:LysR family transcriptional regulator [Candidatus Minthosoma caballi]